MDTSVQNQALTSTPTPNTRFVKASDILSLFKSQKANTIIFW